MQALSCGPRHVVVIACMVAMYLTEDRALHVSSMRHTKKLAISAGSLTVVLMPVVRLWRILYALRSS